MGFYGQLVLEYGPRLAALLLLMLGTMGARRWRRGFIAREEATLRLSSRSLQPSPTPETTKQDPQRPLKSSTHGCSSTSTCSENARSQRAPLRYLAHVIILASSTNIKQRQWIKKVDSINSLQSPVGCTFSSSL